ncbi:hypothetical protein CHU93_02685 [Sandarakinorhabdus cyanobacteriorum]|uniref:HTH marR-type domain-containing protein n=1 Tax=Sandarakinorhabdus cyanobacteriorum TaxID=1981098 RepID=A0A255YZA3_9SPHN|nr:MarR family winged helix-turn-helix transcriptional regulator [Sandarakinorhabdus cyanobacteriorum]OYQ33985.1 hypothetical protein CHU93_02685 [Sandarakinorhabdus cyanobacteriorum]
MSTHDYPAAAGSAALGARLRRLSERIDREADAIYAARAEGFQQRWFGVVNQLDRHGPMGGVELAQTLGVSQAAISQVVGALKAAGLVTSGGDPADARRRVLSLTADGVAAAQRLRPLWAALDDVARALDAEAGGVVAVLDRLETALDRAGLAARLVVCAIK